jgi:hypothetical protein
MLWAHEDLNLGPLPCQGVQLRFRDVPGEPFSQVGDELVLSPDSEPYPLFTDEMWPECGLSVSIHVGKSA